MCHYHDMPGMSISIPRAPTAGIQRQVAVSDASDSD